MINVLSELGDELLSQVAAAAYDTLGLSGEANVELIFLDEEEMRSLNRETRGIDKCTDVLSYPSLMEIKPFTEDNYPLDYDRDNKAVFLGSIVICESVAAKQAEEYGHSVTRERAYLFLHGLLHLLGYDHIEDADKEVMRAKEEQVLSKMGVNR